MTELSVIMPYVNEWPQIVFTVRSIAEELRGIDFELIAVSNFAPDDLAKQGVHEPDRGHAQVPAVVRGHSWLKAVTYNEKLSHWQAKNYGVSKADGDILFFCDAHVVPGRNSIRNAFLYYKNAWENLNGTLHLPLTYHILEYHKLIYKLVINKPAGELHYSFTGYRDAESPYEVPCMSTCGMMMHRSIYDELGGWPEGFGIYGGGENFINFVLAILGKKKWIMPGEPLYHHGDSRGYSYNYDDYSKNRAIAVYMAGSEEWLDLFIRNRKGDKRVLSDIRNRVIYECREHREMIENSQITTIDEWADGWTQSA